MEIEHVTGVGFAAWGTAEEERNFAVRSGVLGKIVIHAESVAGSVAEVFADGATGVGRQILHGGGIGSAGRNDDGVFHGAGVFESLHHLGNRGTLLADGDVDTNHVAALLIDDGVEGDGGFAGLAVTDDQFALAAADRNHAVDGLDTGLHGLLHGLTVDNTRRDALNGVQLHGENGALAVDGAPEGVHNTADHGFADRHGHNFTRTANFATFANLLVVTQKHGADLILFEVHGDT